MRGRTRAFKGILIPLVVSGGVVREGFSEEVTRSRDLDGARSQPSGSRGEECPRPR